VPVSDVCVLLICSVYALRHMFKPVLLTDSANFAVTQYQHNTMVYCLTNAYTTRCLWQLGVYHVSRDLAVFAGAWLWLSGWLAEISADLRETVAYSTSHIYL